MSLLASYEKINGDLIAAFNDAGIKVEGDHEFFDREYGPTIPDITNYFCNYSAKYSKKHLTGFSASLALFFRDQGDELSVRGKGRQ